MRNKIYCMPMACKRLTCIIINNSLKQDSSKTTINTNLPCIRKANAFFNKIVVKMHVQLITCTIDYMYNKHNHTS